MIRRITASLGAAVMAAGLFVVASGPANSAPEQPQAASAAPAVAAPAVVPMKNRSCGYGVKTKAHTCDLAFSLIRRYFDEGSPATLWDVYSPSSGNYYYVSCYAGYTTTTCRTSRNNGRTFKGSVTFKPAWIPTEYYCATDIAGYDAYGWLGAGCGFVSNTANAYEEGAFNEGWQWIYDPDLGRSRKVDCYGVSPTICYSNKVYLLIRN